MCDAAVWESRVKKSSCCARSKRGERPAGERRVLPLVVDLGAVDGIEPTEVEAVLTSNQRDVCTSLQANAPSAPSNFTPKPASRGLVWPPTTAICGCTRPKLKATDAQTPMEHARRSMNRRKRAGSRLSQARTLGMVCCLTCLSTLSALSSASAQDEPAEPTVPDEAAENRFLDGLDWQVMASGFYLFNSNLVAGPYNDLDYPYTGYMGFGLNFAGGDVSYTGEKFGITLGLRFGSGAAQLSALDPIKQAFVSWMPHRKLTLDFGWFDSIYGAEVADEWKNPTFTRGALYFLQQPFNHLGLRIAATFTDWLALRLLVVNEEVGVGTIGGSAIDQNATPAFGARLDFSPIDAVTLELGYLTGASGLNGNRAWGQFFDLILTVKNPARHLGLEREYDPRPSGRQRSPFARGSALGGHAGA